MSTPGVQRFQAAPRTDCRVVDDLVAAANVSGDPSSDRWREVLSSVVFNSNATQLNCLDELGQRFMAMGLVYPAHVWCVHLSGTIIACGMILTRLQLPAFSQFAVWRRLASGVRQAHRPRAEHAGRGRHRLCRDCRICEEPHPGAEGPRGAVPRFAATAAVQAATSVACCRAR
jgi:hypothetical protein